MIIKYINNSMIIICQIIKMNNTSESKSIITIIIIIIIILIIIILPVKSNILNCKVHFTLVWYKRKHFENCTQTQCFDSQGSVLNVVQTSNCGTGSVSLSLVEGTPPSEAG